MFQIDRFKLKLIGLDEIYFRILINQVFKFIIEL